MRLKPLFLKKVKIPSRKNKYLYLLDGATCYLLPTTYYLLDGATYLCVIAYPVGF